MPLESVRALFKTKANRPPNRWQKGFIAVYLGVALFSTIAELVYYIKYQRPTTLFLWLAIPYAAIAWWALRDLANERTCARMMLIALKDGGSSLAWVYVEKTSGTRESTSLHYCFTNHKHGEFLGDETTIHELFQFFAHFTSQLSTGYSAELEKQFHRAPMSLKTAPVRGSGIKYTEVHDSPSNG